MLSKKSNKLSSNKTGKSYKNKKCNSISKKIKPNKNSNKLSGKKTKISKKRTKKHHKNLMKGGNLTYLKLLKLIGGGKLDDYPFKIYTSIDINSLKSRIIEDIDHIGQFSDSSEVNSFFGLTRENNLYNYKLKIK